MGIIAQSFRSADDKPLVIDNKSKKAKNIFEDLQKLDDEDLVREMEKIATKRKRESAASTSAGGGAKKRTKKTLSPIKKRAMCSTSLYSPETSNTTNDGFDDDWSDCDEKELSKSINLFNQSICMEPTSNSDSNNDETKNSPEPTHSKSEKKDDSVLHGTSLLADLNDDDNTQWDEDDAELLHGVSLIETSFSSAKPDRSVLQEISNLSWTDQSESGSHSP